MYYFNYYWLVGGSIRDIGCGFVFVVDNVVYFIGGLVFCLFVVVFLCLVVILFMVWWLFVLLVVLLGYVVGSEIVSDCVDIVDFWYFVVVGEYDVGVGVVVGYFGLFVDFYVVDIGD